MHQRKNNHNSQAKLKDQQAALGHHGTQVRAVNKESQKLGDDLSNIEDPLPLQYMEPSHQSLPLPDSRLSLHDTLSNAT